MILGNIKMSRMIPNLKDNKKIFIKSQEKDNQQTFIKNELKHFAEDTSIHGK